MVVHSYNPGTGEDEAGGFQVQDQSGLYGEILYQNTAKQNRNLLGGSPG
jgi:hypothetical protein